MGNFFSDIGKGLQKVAGFAAPLLGGAANMLLPGSGALVSGLFGGLGGAAAPTGMSAPTEVKNQSIWGPQAGALQDLYGRSKNWMDQYGGMTPEEKQGQANLMSQYGTGGQAQQIGNNFIGMGQGLANQGYGAATNFLNQAAPTAGIDMGVMGAAQNNPYATATMDAMAGDVTRNMQRSILPSIRNRAGAGGLVGSTRAGVAEGLAASDASRQISDMASKYRGDLYQNALNMGGQFGLKNADILGQRQKDIAEMGAGLGGAGMGYQQTGLGNINDALAKYMGAAGMGRDITGGALDRYGKLIGGPTVLTNEMGGMKDQGDMWSNIATGIGGAIDQYGTRKSAAEDDLMSKYMATKQPGFNQADFDKYKAANKPSGFFGSIFGS